MDDNPTTRIATCTGSPPSLLTQGSEAGANLFRQELRLGGEVTALGEPVEVDQRGIGLFRPTNMRSIEQV